MCKDLSAEIDSYLAFFTHKEAEYQEKRVSIAQKKHDLVIFGKKNEVYREAKDFIIGLNTVVQEKLKSRIENLLTLALRDVFEHDYRAELEFDIKRNQSEIEIVVWDGEIKLSPKTDVGGGIIDICSFALRIILWFIAQNRTDAVIILDEPFKNLSKEYQPNASKLLNKLSEMFGVQFIIITHEDLLISGANRVLRVGRKAGISEVEVVL